MNIMLVLLVSGCVLKLVCSGGGGGARHPHQEGRGGEADRGHEVCQPGVPHHLAAGGDQSLP